MARRVTNKIFLSRVAKANPNVVPLEEYKDSATKVKVMYKTCEHIDYKLPRKLYAGQGCGNFSCRNKRLSESKVKLVAKENTKRLSEMGIRLQEKYRGGKLKHLVLNENCGHEYEVVLANALQGSGCPVCHGIKDLDSYVKEINTRYPNQYDVQGDYINGLTPIKTKHLECGYTWSVAPKHLLCSERCPNCIKSKGERYVAKWLDKNRVSYKEQFRFDDCRNELPLPFDFAIKVNGKKALIEFDGAQHFEGQSGLWGQNNFKDITRNDRIKNNYCNERGIPLLRIPYWWIRNDRADRELSEFIKEVAK